MKTPDKFTKLYRNRTLTQQKKPTIKTTYTTDSLSDQQTRDSQTRTRRKKYKKENKTSSKSIGYALLSQRAKYQKKSKSLILNGSR